MFIAPVLTGAAHDADDDDDSDDNVNDDDDYVDDMLLLVQDRTPKRWEPLVYGKIDLIRFGLRFNFLASLLVFGFKML